MSKINVKLENIGGLKDWSGEFQRGKVNLVLGSAASGKSSILKGMQVALAGSMNNALQSSVEERQQLNLDDKSDENGIIHRNAKIGKAAVVTNSTMFEVEIPRSGSLMAKGGGVAESLTTTMLARLPATRVVREVFEGTSDDFSWMVDDLSDAAQYVLWENTVNAVHRELEQKMLDFEQWRATRKEVDASLASLESEKSQLEGERGAAKSAGQGALEDLHKEISRIEPLARTHRTSARQDEAKYTQMIQQNQRAEAEIERIQREIRRYKRALQDAEETTPPVQPNLDAELERKMMLEAEISALSTTSSGGEWVDAALRDHERGHVSEEAEVLQLARTHSSSAVDRVSTLQDELRSLTNQIAFAQNAYQTQQHAYLRSEQSARQARGAINSLQPQLSQAESERPYGARMVEDAKNKMDESRNTADEYEEQIAELQQQLSSSGNETPELDRKIADLEREIGQLARTVPQHFRLRLDSVRMTEAQAPSYTLEQTSPFGEGNPSVGDVADYLRSRLRSWTAQDVQGGMLSLFNNAEAAGTLTTLLSELLAMKNHCAEQAESHRLKARTIFNEIGASIFAKLSLSPMKSITLDGLNQLSIVWSDGSTTGLTGSEGERTLIASAILIALREAYTPEIPVLMLDGMLDNLNDEPREELVSFLNAYAGEKDIAVIATRLDDGRPTPAIV